MHTLVLRSRQTWHATVTFFRGGCFRPESFSADCERLVDGGGSFGGRGAILDIFPTLLRLTMAELKQAAHN